MQYTSHTRGNTTTKNKLQVFLVTAAQDATEREELTALLLDHGTGANLCVWTADGIPTGEDLSQLSDMSLFVLAVTAATAGHELAAAAQAVRFCYENKIPLLPVYYISPDGSKEPAASFYRIVSDALGKPKSKLELDGAVRSQEDFKEQFARRLHALIPADSVVEEATGNFEKQIFLSYRKKDREQAIRVMKAIHALPMCEAIAFWFDDFLTAGRDFNDEIQKQLAESDAFALALTDHISEEGNYVLREEWPRAAELKKKEDRLLVEAGEPDQETLRSVNPPMTDPIPVGDPEVLRKAIELSCLLDGGGKALSARQKYLLGIAYLSGIRVEKDQTHALRLLTEAANEGCAEAALQLGFMYLARIGVERDNDAALKWKELAFDLAEAQGAGETAYRVAFGQDGLVLMEYAMDRQDRARDVCRRMREMLESDRTDDLSVHHHAWTLIEEADPHFDLREALTPEILRQRLALAEKGTKMLKSLPSDTETEEDLSSGLKIIGDLKGRLGEFEEAESRYKECLLIRQKLADRTGSAAHRKMLASVWTSLGLLYGHMFRQQPAEDAFAKAVPLLEGVYAETNLPSDLEALCYAYSNYGSTEQDYKQGKEYLEKAIALMEQVVRDDPQDAHLKQNLEDLREALKVQKKKPLIQKLLVLLIVLVLGGALVFGIGYLINAIIS